MLGRRNIFYCTAPSLNASKSFVCVFLRNSRGCASCLTVSNRHSQEGLCPDTQKSVLSRVAWLCSMKPRLAITIGDPSGVGPELALRCASDREMLDLCVPLLLGDLSNLRCVGERLRLPLPSNVLPLRHWEHRFQEIDSPTIVDFESSIGDVVAGVFNASTGAASFAYVSSAIDFAIAEQVDGIVTGPIQKEAWHLAGIEYPGHTELLADRTRFPRACMMLTSETISCALVTVHVGLAEVAASLTINSILETIVLAHDAVSRWRGRDARVAVCGLNPHAGESGMFGDNEEERFIVPAIDKARSKGIEVRGPLPADTAFVPTIRDWADVYVCMYHDQGLIPLKTLAFDEAVNVTLGLPIVRTSVDHGTALDIAWQGIASAESIKQAIRLAAKMAS